MTARESVPSLLPLLVLCLCGQCTPSSFRVVLALSFSSISAPARPARPARLLVSACLSPSFVCTLALPPLLARRSAASPDFCYSSASPRSERPAQAVFSGAAPSPALVAPLFQQRRRGRACGSLVRVGEGGFSFHCACPRAVPTLASLEPRAITPQSALCEGFSCALGVGACGVRAASGGAREQRSGSGGILCESSTSSGVCTRRRRRGGGVVCVGLGGAFRVGSSRRLVFFEEVRCTCTSNIIRRKRFESGVGASALFIVCFHYVRVYTTWLHVYVYCIYILYRPA